jgi:hypothetical protein
MQAAIVLGHKDDDVWRLAGFDSKAELDKLPLDVKVVIRNVYQNMRVMDDKCAEQQQRIADLEAKRDELFAERNKAEAQRNALAKLIDSLAQIPAPDHCKPGDATAEKVADAWRLKNEITKGHP